MIRRLLLICLAFLGLIWLARRSRPATRRPRSSARSGGAMVRDRICETFIPVDSALTVTRNGQVHYFCSEICLKRFDASTNPSRKRAV